MSSIVVSGGKTIEEIIEKDGVYPSVTVGKSMKPLFKTHRDMVVLEKCVKCPEKYDVVLYRVGEKYVLHRVIGIDKEKKIFIIRGDNTFKKEYVPFGAVIARLSAFTRKGKHGTVCDKSYKVYSRVWNFIYPARYVVNFFRRAVLKMYRIVFGKNNTKKTN